MLCCLFILLPRPTFSSPCSYLFYLSSFASFLLVIASSCPVQMVLITSEFRGDTYECISNWPINRKKIYVSFAAMFLLLLMMWVVLWVRSLTLTWRHLSMVGKQCRAHHEAVYYHSICCIYYYHTIYVITMMHTAYHSICCIYCYDIFQTTMHITYLRSEMQCQSWTHVVLYILIRCLCDIYYHSILCYMYAIHVTYVGYALVLCFLLQ